MSGDGQRAARRASIALAGLTLLLASNACVSTERTEPAGSLADDNAVTTTSGTSQWTSTSTSTSTPISASMAEGLMPGDLRACENPSRYTTDSDWALSELPNSYRIARAATFVQELNPSTAPPGLESWLLIEPSAGGGMDAAIALKKGVDPDRQLSGTGRDEHNAVNGVRGLPGLVSRRSHRGDVEGWTVAEWSEDGVAWEASSRLEERELARALEPLDLDQQSVVDSSGRFEVAGHVPAGMVNPRRVTTLELRRESATSGAAQTLHIRIDARPPGSWGLDPSLAIATGLPLGPGSRVDVSSGTSMLSSGPGSPDQVKAAIDLFSGAWLAFADGSSGTFLWEGQRDVDDTRPDPASELFPAVLASLVPAVPHDPLLAGVPLIDADATRAAGETYCIEE